MTETNRDRIIEGSISETNSSDKSVASMLETATRLVALGAKTLQLDAEVVTGQDVTESSSAGQISIERITYDGYALPENILNPQGLSLGELARNHAVIRRNKLRLRKAA